MPGIPYCLNKKGHGVAWTNSLFENNAELALGMYLSVKQQREKQLELVREYYEETRSEYAMDWIDTYNDIDASQEATDLLIAELEEMAMEDAFQEDLSPRSFELARKILRRKDYLCKKSFWMYGGDGWA